MHVIDEDGNVLEHYGVKGMRWGSRKKSYKTYMEKERAYEVLNLKEGQRLPKNWKKKVKTIDDNTINSGKQKVLVALGLIGGLVLTRKVIKG
jgi:negative regulator of sigma E activity